MVDLAILHCLLELGFLLVARVGPLLLVVLLEGEVLLLAVLLEGEAPLLLRLRLLLLLVRLLRDLLLAALVAEVVLVVVAGVEVPLVLLCAEERSS